MEYLSTLPMLIMFSKSVDYNMYTKNIFISISFRVLFIFRHPKSVDVATVFLSPFESIVWIAMIGLGLLSAYLLRITFSVENKQIEKSINEESYSNSLLMVFGFIFQQCKIFYVVIKGRDNIFTNYFLTGYSGNPWLTSSRILTISVLVFSVLVFQFYSSFIVGSLLTEAPKNIKTVKQLLNSPFEFGVDVVPYVIDNFHIAKEESTVQLYNKIMINPETALMPLHTGLLLLKQGKFFRGLFFI